MCINLYSFSKKTIEHQRDSFSKETIEHQRDSCSSGSYYGSCYQTSENTFCNTTDEKDVKGEFGERGEFGVSAEIAEPITLEEQDDVTICMPAECSMPSAPETEIDTEIEEVISRTNSIDDILEEAIKEVIDEEQDPILPVRLPHLPAEKASVVVFSPAYALENRQAVFSPAHTLENRQTVFSPVNTVENRQAVFSPNVVENRQAVSSPADAVVSANIVDDSNKCVVCMDFDREVVLLTCKHFVLCKSCSPSCKTCPICRVPYTPKQAIVIFKS
jgi:hypothetical protein